jgi:Putative prokaryotic signal transducing protein
MKELIRSNDLVLLSYIEALLKEAHVPYEFADEHMSAVVGSIDASPRRVLVDDGHWARAKEIVEAAQGDRAPTDGL